MEITLRWWEPVDLDLWVLEPGGDPETGWIYFGQHNQEQGHPDSPTGGHLQFDEIPDCETSGEYVEHVVWSTETAPEGTYTVRVDLFNDCNSEGSPQIEYEVIIRVNGVLRDPELGVLDDSEPGETDEDEFTFEVGGEGDSGE